MIHDLEGSVEEEFPTLMQEIKSLGSQGKARLITLLTDRRRQGEETPRLDFNLIERAKSNQNLSLHERAIRLLQYFVQKSENRLGGPIEVDLNNGIRDYVLSLIESPVSPNLRRGRVEIQFFCDYLKRQGLIESPGNRSDHFYVTMEGYANLESLSHQVNSNKVFVALWFDDSMNEAYNHGFQLGIQDAGYDPFRIDIDRADFSGKLDDLIIAEIRSSKALVADFTHGEQGARGSVYFEAGFAYGLGLPIVFSCRKDCIESLHFDTRQYSHIPWEKPQDIRGKLKTRILALIGAGQIGEAVNR